MSSQQPASYGDFRQDNFGSDHKKGKKDCDRYPRKKCDDDCTSNLSPWAAYLIWFIVLIVFIGILRAYGIRWFSAVIFSLIISWIILACVYPFDKTDCEYNYHSNDAFFGFITTLTVILLIIWVIWKVFTDRPHHGQHHHAAHHADGVKLEPTGDAGWNWNFFSIGSKGTTVGHGEGSIVNSPGAAPSVGSPAAGPF